MNTWGPWEPWILAASEMYGRDAWEFIYSSPWLLACSQMTQRDFEVWRYDKRYI